MAEEENGNNMQEVLAQLQQQAPKKKWSDTCKELFEKINAMDPKDRLEYSTCVFDIIQAIMFSMQGWTQWYKIQFQTAFNKKPLSDMNEEDWKAIFCFFKEIGAAILNYDMNFTKAVEDRQEKEREEKLQKKEKTVKKKSTYVS